MPARPTPHQPRLAALAVLFAAYGLLAGRPEAVALAAPPVVLLLLGALARPVGLRAELRLANDRCVEGEPLDVTVTLLADDAVTQADVEIALGRGLALAGGARRHTVTMPASGERVVGLTVRPTRWGVHQVGPVGVTVHRRWRLAAGLVTLEAVPLRVLPAVPDFRAGDAVPGHRAFTGSHVSRAAGDGMELAGIRTYQPGDALRRVNWRVSARRPGPGGSALHVTDYRPERSTDLVLFVDTFADVGPLGESTLDVGVRAAAAIAEHFLARMDRVGVVSLGGVLRWLVAGTGRHQLHTVTDHLLGTALVGSYAWKDITRLPPVLLPPRALVVAVSPLLDERAIGAMAELNRRGHDVVVLDTAPPDPFPPDAAGSGPSGSSLARRIWRLERDDLVRRLADSGVTVAPWRGTGSLDAALTVVSRRSRAAVLR